MPKNEKTLNNNTKTFKSKFLLLKWSEKGPNGRKVQHTLLVQSDFLSVLVLLILFLALLLWPCHFSSSSALFSVPLRPALISSIPLFCSMRSSCQAFFDSRSAAIRVCLCSFVVFDCIATCASNRSTRTSGLSTVHFPSVIFHGTPITLLTASVWHLSWGSNLRISRALNTPSAFPNKISALLFRIPSQTTF